MSDELRLPDDLAAVEARLAAKPLAACGIERDELVYRAGWAACEAQLSNAMNGSVRLPRRNVGIIAAWSLASAATAAALAVVLTLQRGATVEPQVASRKIEAPIHVAVPTGDADATAIGRRELKPSTLPELPSQAGMGLLSLRRQALNSAWEQPTAALTANGSGPPAAKTARELMQELLPSETVPSTRIWPWISTPRGEPI